ncbi:MAG TPA: hypothetical protein DCE42_06970 [Myxococcales bacterium]|nr:hypothetical protein [Deltaproteobacteria bacterium]MBU48510.1 hypothetical protein [Deltaproteobacteria bacterium]HAA54480.1 hypothetical protein [Myxococcales bacterium]
MCGDDVYVRAMQQMLWIIGLCLLGYKEKKEVTWEEIRVMCMRSMVLFALSLSSSCPVGDDDAVHEVDWRAYSCRADCQRT